MKRLDKSSHPLMTLKYWGYILILIYIYIYIWICVIEKKKKSANHNIYMAKL